MPTISSRSSPEAPCPLERAPRASGDVRPTFARALQRDAGHRLQLAQRAECRPELPHEDLRLLPRGEKSRFASRLKSAAAPPAVAESFFRQRSICVLQSIGSSFRRGMRHVPATATMLRCASRQEDEMLGMASEIYCDESGPGYRVIRTRHSRPSSTTTIHSIGSMPRIPMPPTPALPPFSTLRKKPS